MKLYTNVLLVDYYNYAKGGPFAFRLSPTVSDQRSTEVAAIMTYPPEGEARGACLQHAHVRQKHFLALESLVITQLTLTLYPGLIFLA